MISKFTTPSMSASAGGATGGTDKTILFVGLLLGGFLLWKFVIKPEMDKKNTIIYESDNDGNE
jgi:hypothetical protein